jgi:hypothetical protein
MFALAFVAVLSFVVMSLWNALIPELFRLPALDFWQAAGLLILSRILFGGLRGRGGWHGHGGWRRHMWQRQWDNMTPEERERLRAKFKHHRCGWGPGEPPTAEPPTADPANDTRHT